MDSSFRLLGTSRFSRRWRVQEGYSCPVFYFEVLTYCFRCLRWICCHFSQISEVHVTTKLRQSIFYDVEVLVLRVGVSLRVETEVGRTHVGSDIRNMKDLYLWKCIVSRSRLEVILEFGLGFCIADLIYLLTELSSDILHRRIELVVRIDHLCTWDVTVFA